MGNVGNVGDFWKDLARSERVIERYVRKLEDYYQFEEPTLEDDKAGVDRWIVKGGERLGVEFKVLFPSNSKMWEDELQMEVCFDVNKIGWSWDTRKRTDLFIWIWDVKPYKVLLLSKDEFEKLREDAVKHELFHKNTFNLQGSGCCWWLHREVVNAWLEGDLEGAKSLSKKYKNQVPKKKFVQPGLSREEMEDRLRALGL